MSILSTAKGRVSNALASKRSLRTALKSEAGAFDLASIMVGLIILGIAVGIIAATVFLVIPWSQDKAAKSQLDSIVQAENTYIGLTADKGAAVQKYSEGANDKIVDPNDATKVIFDGGNSGDIAISASGAGNTAAFKAAVKSGSGKIFVSTNEAPKPTEAPASVTSADDAVK